jgi:hypothetical protein
VVMIINRTLIKGLQSCLKAINKTLEGLRQELAIMLASNINNRLEGISKIAKTFNNYV